MAKNSAKKPVAKVARKIKPGETLSPAAIELFERQQKYLAAGKANYKRADKALADLLKLCEPGVVHTLQASGRKPPLELTLVDQFADTNSVWSGSSCKRFAIIAKEIKPQDR